MTEEEVAAPAHPDAHAQAALDTTLSAPTLSVPTLSAPESKPRIVRADAAEATQGSAQSNVQSIVPSASPSASRGMGKKRERVSVPWELAVPALFAGSLLAGGLSLPPREAPFQARARRAAEPLRILPTVPSSQTWVVKPQQAFSFVSLQGRLGRGKVVEGHVALSGRVSRVMVREGQHVDVGDRVLTLSTTERRVSAATGADLAPSRAEGEQVDAVRRKEALETRIGRAHTDYAESQARLEATNKKLADARALLKRVSAGEQVLDPRAAPSFPSVSGRRDAQAPDGSGDSRSDSRSDSRGSGATPSPSVSAGPSRADAARLEGAESENRAALAASEQAQDAVREAASKAKGSLYVVSGALSRERLAKATLEDAHDKKASVQAQLNEGTAKADALAEADSAVSQAELGLADAQKKTKAVQDEAQDAQDEADKARSKASKAVDRVAQALRDLKAAQKAARDSASRASSAAPSAPQPEAPTPTRSGTRSAARSTLSPSAAVRLVREAMAEASAAASDAERLKSRVESFKGAASSISSDIQASAQGIRREQERVMDATIETSLSTLRAPASGTVLSVAGEDEGVSQGQAVVRVASGSQALVATLQDSTDAWKKLRVDSTLPGRLLSSPLAGADAQASGIGAAAGTLTAGGSPLQAGAPVTLKVLAVEAPEQAGGAAQIRVAIVPGSSPVAQPQTDMAVALAVPRGRSAVLSIPVGAVARGAGRQPVVGVLREVSEPSTSGATGATGEVSDAAAGAPNVSGAPGVSVGAPATQSAGAGEGAGQAPALDSPKAPPEVLEAARPKPAAPRERLFEVEWRTVALSGTVLQPTPGSASPQLQAEKMQEVISGLLPGDRILSDASLWRGRFIAVPGKPLRVRLLVGRS